MRAHLPVTILLLATSAVPAAAQSAAPFPRPGASLAGVWELVSVNGKPLPLSPDNTEVAIGCDVRGEYMGEYAGVRVGEGQLVINPEVMFFNRDAGSWTGGVYAHIPKEAVCRHPNGQTNVVRVDGRDQAGSARAVSAVWQDDGSYIVEEDRPLLRAADREWTIRSAPGTGLLRLVDAADGAEWLFRRGVPGPRFNHGMTTLLGDIDEDRVVDQVRVEPGPHDEARLTVYHGHGGVDVLEIPNDAKVTLARGPRTWRNADGRTLQVGAREVILVAREPAPEHTDVTIYVLRNGNWVRWEYEPN